VRTVAGAGLVAATLALVQGHASAQTFAPQPLVGLDDTRSEGPATRSWLELGVDPAWIVAPDDAGGNGDVQLMRFRVMLGPPTFDLGQVRDIMGGLGRYAFRVEGMLVGSESTTYGGPLTFALQRYSPAAPISIAPLIDLHSGIELAMATPWVADHGHALPRALAVVNGVDTELVESGWSLRPLSTYVRLDAFVCRFQHLEAGLAPELFVPDVGADQAHLRFHVEAGVNFGCNRKSSAWRHVGLDLGYRGRVRLHADSLPVDYAQQLSLGLQLDFTSSYLDGVLALFVADDPSQRDTTLIGARLQLGFGGFFRRHR
jgi:hypothetical protein